MAGKKRAQEKAHKRGPARRMTPAPYCAPCVVGIGASAGGFEPIRTLINAMPADSGLVFVVIQHLLPTHKSFAVKLLGRRTAMKVVKVTDRMRIEPNCVYTTPSDKFVQLKGNVLHLVSPRLAHGQRLPIDHFFGSLGEHRHERAIGVILSGTGSDGTMGARAIASHGGLVLAQSPESAQFDGLPQSAIAAGTVNQVLAVEAMPKALLAYARHSYVAGQAVALPVRDDAQALESLLALVRDRRGFDFSEYKQGTLLRRIHRRMALHNVDAIADYRALLERVPNELDALYRDLFIGVTEFFRDPQAWQALRSESIVPLVEAHKDGEPIRAWVPGCATGEEAYTLATLLLAELKSAGKHSPVQIFATDVNMEALQTGRAGVYPGSAAARIPIDLLQQYFVAAAEAAHYQVKPDLRAAVTFSTQNVFADPPLSRMDIISCRNVLINLAQPVQDRVIALFRFALKPGGALFLGSTESPGKHGRLFASVAKKWRIFKARGTAPAAELIPSSAARRSGVRAPDAEPRSAARTVDAGSIARQIVLDRHAPAAILVNSSFEALYYLGPTENVLTGPRGTPSTSLLTQTREGLRPHVRSAVRKALLSHRKIVVSNARARRGNRFVPIRITVEPAWTEHGKDPLFLVVFEESSLPARGMTAGQQEHATIRALETELRATRSDLQTSLDDLESANEELTAAHNEVLSSNNELQSINEELESSTKELQLLNEELNTANQQLQKKIADVEASKDTLSDIFASSEIETLWLDHDLHIRWFTPALQKRFHLQPADIGRPVTGIAALSADASLLNDAATVRDTFEAVESELIVDGDRHYTRRILPFRATQGQALGVIVNFFDVTEICRMTQSALEERQQQAALLKAQVRERTAKLRDLVFALTTAEERERRNLAQNLHDDLSQVLSVAQIKLAAHVGKTGAIPALKEVQILLEQVNEKAHSLAFQLSPSVLYKLGLMPALRWLGDEMGRMYGLSVKVYGDLAEKCIDEALRTTLYVATRELLINIAKHAGVDTAEVEAETVHSQMIVRVRDKGAGFDLQSLEQLPRPPGFGLVSVRERLEMIGGDMDIASRNGDGTTVTLTVPYAVDQAGGEQ